MPTASASGLQDLVVITGFSGAGKSTALAVFEAAGYFCVAHRDIAKRQELVG
jgi:UPF0042 nucleotide-binding protein